MRLIAELALLAIYMLALPFFLGSVIGGRGGRLFPEGLIHSFVGGWVMMLACFECVCVPLILLHRSLTAAIVCFHLLLVACLVLVRVWRERWGREERMKESRGRGEGPKEERERKKDRWGERKKDRWEEGERRKDRWEEGERQSHTACKFPGKPLHRLIESCVTEKAPLRKMASIFILHIPTAPQF